jgi:hypothetical protein
LFLRRISIDAPNVVRALSITNADDRSVAAWAAGWGLADDWMIDVARRTLAFWRELPAAGKHLQWAPSDTAGRFVPEPTPIVWEPTIETEREFRERIERYIADVRRWAEDEIGLVKTPAKPQLNRDLGALVRYQVKNQPLTTIAREVFGGEDREDTARKAIASVANLIDLTLRK